MSYISIQVVAHARNSNRTKKLPNEDLANESRSTHITVATDMVFSLSHHLNGVRMLSACLPHALIGA